MNKRMSPAHYWLCRTILLLDKVPLPMKTIRLRPLPQKEQWRMVKFYGTNILVVRNWFHLFAFEHTFRQAVKRSNGQEQDR